MFETDQSHSFLNRIGECTALATTERSSMQVRNTVSLNTFFVFFSTITHIVTQIISFIQ